LPPLSFLRARNFSLKNTLSMLRDDVAWRIEMNVDALRASTADEILGCPAHEVIQHLPIFQRGQDKEGRPIFYQQGGGFWIDKVRLSVGFVVQARRAVEPGRVLGRAAP
jgi:hypothetical protein